MGFADVVLGATNKPTNLSHVVQQSPLSSSSTSANSTSTSSVAISASPDPAPPRKKKMWDN